MVINLIGMQRALDILSFTNNQQQGLCRSVCLPLEQNSFIFMTYEFINLISTTQAYLFLLYDHQKNIVKVFLTRSLMRSRKWLSFPLQKLYKYYEGFANFVFSLSEINTSLMKVEPFLYYDSYFTLVTGVKVIFFRQIVVNCEVEVFTKCPSSSKITMYCAEVFASTIPSETMKIPSV